MYVCMYVSMCPKRTHASQTLICTCTASSSEPSGLTVSVSPLPANISLAVLQVPAEYVSPYAYYTHTHNSYVDIHINIVCMYICIDMYVCMYAYI